MNSWRKRFQNSEYSTNIVFVIKVRNKEKSRKMTSKFLVPKAKYDSCSDSCSSNEFVSPTPGRKRKLDHLSYEEKVQRKKLKNRVAAQTSRDRKKRQMEDMQDTIEQQSLQITVLERRCEQLANERDKILAKYEKLQKDNEKVKARTAGRKPEAGHNIPEEHKYTRSALDDTSVDNCVGSITIKTEGSAESTKPLLKVTKMEIESTKQSTKVRSQSKSEVKALLKVILLCLLYRSSSKISSSTNSTLSSLQKACSKMSRQTWKQMFHQASLQMPKSKAANSHCLNEWWGPTTKQWNPPKIAA